MKHRGLSPAVVAGLDAARACAAIYVVVHHLANARGLSHGWGIIFRFGQEAVIVFFLLSGFVIFANERDRAHRPIGYFLRRVRRIYPPLIAAMLLSTLVAFDNGDLAGRFSVQEMVGTLMGLQDISFLKPGVVVDPYLGNDPLWSLSYEVAFYALFPLVLGAWRRIPRLTGHIVGAACCLCYADFAVSPNHASLVAAYFLLWWCGAMAANAYLDGRRTIGAIATPTAWLVALCVTAAIPVAIHGAGKGVGYYPLLPLRHFVAAATVLVICFGPIGGALARWSVIHARGFGAAASISYGLYVLHFPLLVDWKRADTPSGLTVAIVLLLLLAWLIERQLPRLLPRAPSS